MHVGILSSRTYETVGPSSPRSSEALRERICRRQNLTIERRYDSSKVKDNASELAGMKLDAIPTTCTPSTRAMKETILPHPSSWWPFPTRCARASSSLAKPGRERHGNVQAGGPADEAARVSKRAIAQIDDHCGAGQCEQSGS
jgi:hypothetical protein